MPPFYHADAIGWGEQFLDLLRRRYKLMGVAQPGLANRYYAVRYMHLISSRVGLSSLSFRTKSFLKAIAKRSDRRQEIPFALDLLS